MSKKLTDEYVIKKLKDYRIIQAGIKKSQGILKSMRGDLIRGLGYGTFILSDKLKCELVRCVMPERKIRAMEYDAIRFRETKGVSDTECQAEEGTDSRAVTPMDMHRGCKPSIDDIVKQAKERLARKKEGIAV